MCDCRATSGRQPCGARSPARSLAHSSGQMRPSGRRLASKWLFSSARVVVVVLLLPPLLRRFARPVEPPAPSSSSPARRRRRLAVTRNQPGAFCWSCAAPSLRRRANNAAPPSWAGEILRERALAESKWRARHCDCGRAASRRGDDTAQTGAGRSRKSHKARKVVRL